MSKGKTIRIEQIEINTGKVTPKGILDIIESIKASYTKEQDGLYEDIVDCENCTYERIKEAIAEENERSCVLYIISKRLSEFDATKEKDTKEISQTNEKINTCEKLIDELSAANDATEMIDVIIDKIESTKRTIKSCWEKYTDASVWLKSKVMEIVSKLSKDDGFCSQPFRDIFGYHDNRESEWEAIKTKEYNKEMVYRDVLILIQLLCENKN